MNKLWQIHHQFPDGHTKFVIQLELTDDKDANSKLIHDTINHVWTTNTPPVGAVFVIGNEEWPHFVVRAITTC